MNTQELRVSSYSLPLYTRFPEPDVTIKNRNDCKPERSEVWERLASREPISWRCKRDVRAKDDGVYRTRSEETIDELLFSNIS